MAKEGVIFIVAFCVATFVAGAFSFEDDQAECFDLCDLNLCAEHSTCVNNGGGCFHCFCPPGYTGQRCDSEIPCYPECENGVCFGDQCRCEDGYTGQFCETPIPCFPGCVHGECIGGECVCEPGYTGTFCASPIPCHPGCVRGECSDDKCVCEPGYTGPLCASPIPCYPGCGSGSCYGDDCLCPPQYTGPHCETPIGCDPTCVRGVCLEDRCVCPPGYTGDDCGSTIEPGDGYSCDDTAPNYACTPEHAENNYRLFPYHGDCSKYVECTVGPPAMCYVRDCSTPLIWDPYVHACNEVTEEYPCYLNPPLHMQPEPQRPARGRNQKRSKRFNV